ncbi:hypothetical protein DFH08DRAFT_824196 [Mycena albidolilacea]|uniref:Uncharacterized protein n=1 Tax=Mycena albidolilacea TaxID=1033008 RepID=A0AAD7EAL2_9AGAR|nr:hypothetical protein DFH08DRAFT_824196 [Mycena albidolilacea]
MAAPLDDAVLAHQGVRADFPLSASQNKHEYIGHLDRHSLNGRERKCAKDVREIEKSTLLTIEAENLRRSGANIRECDEICDALGSQSARQRRRLGQGPGAGNTNVSYETLASV